MKIRDKERREGWLCEWTMKRILKHFDHPGEKQSKI